MNQIEKYIEHNNYRELVNSLPNKIINAVVDYTNEQKCSQNFNEAIDLMPEIKTQLTVYRGHNPSSKTITDVNYPLSTSTRIDIPFDEFTSEECCLFKIILQPGVKILPAYLFDKNKNADEFEIIVKQNGIVTKIGEEIYKGVLMTVYKYDAYNVSPQKSSLTTEELKSLMSKLNPDEIDEELEFLDQTPTKKNRIETIKLWLKTDLTNKDYEEIYNNIFLD